MIYMYISTGLQLHRPAHGRRRCAVPGYLYSPDDRVPGCDPPAAAGLPRWGTVRHVSQPSAEAGHGTLSAEQPLRGSLPGRPGLLHVQAPELLCACSQHCEHVQAEPAHQQLAPPPAPRQAGGDCGLRQAERCGCPRGSSAEGKAGHDGEVK